MNKKMSHFYIQSAILCVALAALLAIQAVASPLDPSSAISGSSGQTSSLASSSQGSSNQISSTAAPSSAVNSSTSSLGQSSTASSKPASSSTPSSSSAASSSKPVSSQKPSGPNINDLQDEYKDLQQQQSQLNNQIQNIKNEKDQQDKLQAQIQQQIRLTQQQISLLNQQIETLNTQITQKEQELAHMQINIEGSYEQFKKRVRAGYIARSQSALTMLFGAEDLGDLLVRAEYLRRTTNYERQMIENLHAERDMIQAAKDVIDHDKQQVEESQEELEKKKQELDEQMGQVSYEIQQLLKLEQEYETNKQQIQKEMKELQAEIDRIYAANASSGAYVGGTFGWPVDNYYNISSYFGWRFNNTDYHTGIDISGANINTKPIRAANAGKVIFAKYDYIPGKSYGKYMIIDHGGGYSTLYAHCSSINVKVGDVVTKGQVIGNVGSTGWSTGPHLHFEIRINGKAVNPLGYYSKVS